MSAALNSARRAQEMRQEFDHAFALPPRDAEAARVQLLAIRINEQPFALKLAEIAGLYADKKITHVPGSANAMIGIAGFRGLVAPVYDIAKLMGEQNLQAPRWLVVSAVAPIAFAFSQFEGQLRISPNEIKPQQSQGKGSAFARALLKTETVLRPIIDLDLVIGAVKT